MYIIAIERGLVSELFEVPPRLLWLILVEVETDIPVDALLILFDVPASLKANAPPLLNELKKPTLMLCW
jgi:hypothetical protein